MSDRDVEKTRVMVRVDPPGESGRSSELQEAGKKASGNERALLWVTAGVLIGFLGGALVAWLVITTGTGMTPLSPNANATSASIEATPAAAASADSEDEASDTSSKPDTKKPKTPKITFPSGSQYWVSPDDTKVKIEWDKVTDASGVSYVLEFSQSLATSEAWSSPTRTAKLKGLSYERAVTAPKERFRILAIDGAGNESSPSAYRVLIQAANASEAATRNAEY